MLGFLGRNPQVLGRKRKKSERLKMGIGKAS